jgi:hypothetical protein
MRTGAFDPANASIVPKDTQESGKIYRAVLRGFQSSTVNLVQSMNNCLTPLAILTCQLLTLQQTHRL